MARSTGRGRPRMEEVRRRARQVVRKHEGRLERNRISRRPQKKMQEARVTMVEKRWNLDVRAWARLRRGEDGVQLGQS